MLMSVEASPNFYNEEYFLGTSDQRGNFSLLDLGPKFYDRTETVVDYFDLQSENDGTIVEVGCGTAPFYRIMREQQGVDHVEIVCTDITESGVRLLESADQPPFEIAGAEKLPFEPSSLLGVVEWDVLEHIMQPKEAIAEAHRVLRLGGFLHIVCPNPDSWLRNSANEEKDPYRRDKSHIFPPIVTADFLSETLAEAGFEAEVYTRGFEGSEGQHQMGVAAMRLAQVDSSGTHLVAFAHKV
jgi:SAM-dependent methyltransferase